MLSIIKNKLINKDQNN